MTGRFSFCRRRSVIAHDGVIEDGLAVVGDRDRTGALLMRENR